MAGKRQRSEGRWSESFKRRVVAEAAASDVSASEIARRNGLKPNLLFNWRKKFGADPQATGKEVCLVAVEVKPEKTPVSAVDSGTIGSGFLEIDLPCGAQVRCGNGISPVLLSAALSELRPHTPSTVS